MREVEGRIVKAMSGFYYVLVDNDIITCRARGNFRNDNITPLVGDYARIKIEEDSIGYVVEIKERKNELVRPKVANIDYNIIVTSLKEPEFSSKLLDKLLALNEFNNVESIIVFSKCDMLKDEELEEFTKLSEYYNSIGYKVFTNLSKDIGEFKKYIQGKFVSISGQSGAGKSTFINTISNNEFNIETAKISKHLGRGKHTTRHVEFYKIDDFYIADTPGFSSIDLTFMEKEDLKDLFIEFRDKDCKFNTCNHIDEPKCGVKDSLENVQIESRYNNYKSLFKEIETSKRRY
ncbi:MAG: ribosome small subunit-dependent GTPase A [Gemella sp.]|nr:ribosome small subunit-dependent GTPase A [Gemella sp.]